jgi:hypothetical protein
MTHQEHPTAVREAVQLLAEQGFDGMAPIMQLLLNECMRIKRRQSIGAGPYERSEARRDSPARQGVRRLAEPTAAAVRRPPCDRLTVVSRKSENFTYGINLLKLRPGLAFADVAVTR